MQLKNLLSNLLSALWKLAFPLILLCLLVQANWAILSWTHAIEYFLIFVAWAGNIYLRECLNKHNKQIETQANSTRTVFFDLLENNEEVANALRDVQNSESPEAFRKKSEVVARIFFNAGYDSGTTQTR
jgi:hypothetical protein